LATAYEYLLDLRNGNRSHHQKLTFDITCRYRPLCCAARKKPRKDWNTADNSGQWSSFLSGSAEHELRSETIDLRQGIPELSLAFSLDRHSET
jgi:hypothetical protein